MAHDHVGFSRLLCFASRATGVFATHRFKRSVHLKEVEMCLKEFADDNISEQVMPACKPWRCSKAAGMR